MVILVAFFDSLVKELALWTYISKLKEKSTDLMTKATPEMNLNIKMKPTTQAPASKKGSSFICSISNSRLGS